MAAGKIVLAAGTTYGKQGKSYIRYRAKLSKSKLAYMSGKKLKKAIKSYINKQSETKYVADTTIQNSVVGQAAATPAAFFKLIPRLAQGVQENQRVGDRVKPTSIINRFIFNFDSSVQNNQDVVVNLWLVRVKGAQTPLTVNAITPGNFLKVGNGGNTDPVDPNQPNMLQLVSTYPLNTDQFTLLKHYRFRMRRGIGQATNTNTAAEVAPTGVARNEMYKSITYKCKGPVFKYNSNADLLPQNFYPVCLVYATNADGSAYGDTIRMSISSQMFFKDS